MRSGRIRQDDAHEHGRAPAQAGRPDGGRGVVEGGHRRPVLLQQMLQEALRMLALDVRQEPDTLTPGGRRTV